MYLFRVRVAPPCHWSICHSGAFVSRCLSVDPRANRGSSYGNNVTWLFVIVAMYGDWVLKVNIVVLCWDLKKKEASRALYNNRILTLTTVVHFTRFCGRFNLCIENIKATKPLPCAEHAFSVYAARVSAVGRFE